jgi:hypothetical protein
MRNRIFPILAAGLLSLASCRHPSDAEAVRLVQQYDEKLIEAYRTSDEQLMEGLVGDEEAKKLTGLIGVKYDMGLTLDASLIEFRVLDLQREKGWVDIHTEERWRYCDRRIGSGAVAGRDSKDHYFVRYTLKKEHDRWVVWRVRFDRDPEVGRASAPNQAPAAVFHPMMPGAPAPGAVPSPPREGKP